MLSAPALATPLFSITCSSAYPPVSALSTDIVGKDVADSLDSPSLQKKLKEVPPRSSQREYAYAFRDNSLSIALLHELPRMALDPTPEHDKSNTMRCLLVRPRCTGKTFFGMMWFEFMKGDPNNLLDRTQLKQQYGHLFPKPRQFVCVHLDFSGTSKTFLTINMKIKFNRALTTAELPELTGDSSNPLDALARFITVLRHDRKAAFFIDEYDVLARDSPESLALTAEIFTTLNKAIDRVPYVFVTGASRLMPAGVFNGAGNIPDVSFDPLWATTFGYTWDQIESLYGRYLNLLCQLYRVTLRQLQERMKFWYNGYYFSPESEPNESVYFRFAIDRFLESGTFETYFCQSGLSQLYILPLYTKQFLSELTTEITVSITELKEYRYNPFNPVTTRDLLMLLLGGGVLSLTPITDSHNVVLRVPNKDSLSAIKSILSRLVKP